MRYLVTNIQYDTDGEMIDDLPETIEFDFGSDEVDEDDLEEYLSDEISNITGFCHEGFQYQPLD